MILRLSLFYAARELPRARCLFEAALDVEFVRGKHLEEFTCWCATLPDGAVLELWPASRERPTSRVQLEFAAGNLDVAVDRLDAAGFEVRRLTGTVLAVDPNGNTLALTAAGHPTPRR